MFSYWESTQYKKFASEAKKFSYEIVKNGNHTFTIRDQKLIITHYLKMIKTLGVSLNLPHIVVATAMVYMQRFFVQNTIEKCDPLPLVPTCILLASKIEEYPLNAEFIYSKWIERDKYEWKHIIELERYLMKELYFQMIVFHPFSELDRFVKQYIHSKYEKQGVNEIQETQGNDSNNEIHSNSKMNHVSQVSPVNHGFHMSQMNQKAHLNHLNDSISTELNFKEDLEYKKLMQYSWNIINDFYLSDAILQYPPHVIALSSIYVTSIVFEDEFENGFKERIENWFVQQRISRQVLGEIVDRLFDLYEILKDFKPPLELLGNWFKDQRNPQDKKIVSSPHLPYKTMIPHR